jgi:hypothetical protein
MNAGIPNDKYKPRVHLPLTLETPSRRPAVISARLEMFIPWNDFRRDWFGMGLDSQRCEISNINSFIIHNRCTKSATNVNIPFAV